MNMKQSPFLRPAGSADRTVRLWAADLDQEGYTGGYA